MKKFTLFTFFIIILLAFPNNGYSKIDPMITSKTLVVGFNDQQDKVVCSYKKKLTTITMTNQAGKEAWKYQMKEKERKAFGYPFMDKSGFSFLTYGFETESVMIHWFDYSGNLVKEENVQPKGLEYLFYTMDKQTVFFSTDRENKEKREKLEFSLFNMREGTSVDGYFEFSNIENGQLYSIDIFGKYIFFKEAINRDEGELAEYSVLSEFNLETLEYSRFEGEKDNSEIPFELLDQYTLKTDDFILFLAGRVPNDIDLIIYSTDFERIAILDFETDKLAHPGGFRIKKVGSKIYIAGLGYAHIDNCLRQVGHFLYVVDINKLDELRLTEETYTLWDSGNEVDENPRQQYNFFKLFDRRTSSSSAHLGMEECNDITMKDILEFEVDDKKGVIHLTVQDVYKTFRVETFTYTDPNTGATQTIRTYYTEYKEEAFHQYKYNLELKIEDYKEVEKSGDNAGVGSLNPYFP